MEQITTENFLNYLELRGDIIKNSPILLRYIDNLKYLNINKKIYIVSENKKRIKEYIELENHVIQNIKRDFPTLYRDFALKEILNHI
jgi:hypothetical protein